MSSSIDPSVTTPLLKRYHSERRLRRNTTMESIRMTEARGAESGEQEGIEKFVDANSENTRKSKSYRWWVIFVMSFSGDGWSYEASVMSSVLNMPAFLNHMGYGETGLPKTANMLIGPIYSLGQIVGGFLGSWLADRFGRKSTLWIGTLLVLLSTSLLIWAPSIPVLLFARVIQGASIGLLILGFQVYTAEVANQHERGLLSGASLVSGNAFATIASAVAYGVTYSVGNWGWRLSLAISYIPSVILLGLLFFVPETPRYYYQKGQEAEAREVMIRYHGTDDGKFTPAAQIEFEEMKAAILADKEANNVSWSAFYNSKSARLRTFVALSSQLIWPWAGQSAWTYYFGRMYSYAGIDDVHSQFGINLALSTVQIFSSLLGAWLLDHTGRRFSFLTGIGQAIVFLLCQCALSVRYFDKGEVNRSAGAAFVACYFISQVLWFTFFSPVVYLYICEIFSGPLRAKGFAIGNTLSMLGGFIALVSATPTFDSLKGYTWLLFAGIESVFFVIVFFFYPETKGRTLEEIEVLLGSDAGHTVESAVASDVEIRPAIAQRRRTYTGLAANA